MLQMRITTYLIQEHNGLVVAPDLLKKKLVAVGFPATTIIRKVVKKLGDLVTTRFVRNLTVPNQ